MTIIKYIFQSLLLFLLYFESCIPLKKDKSNPKLENVIHLDKKFNMAWEIDTSSKTIKITLEHAGKGYVGIGFSETGFMSDADMFIGGVNEKGKPYLGVSCLCIIIIPNIIFPFCLGLSFNWLCNSSFG